MSVINENEPREIVLKWSDLQKRCRLDMDQAPPLEIIDLADLTAYNIIRIIVGKENLKWEIIPPSEGTWNEEDYPEIIIQKEEWYVGWTRVDLEISAVSEVKGYEITWIWNVKMRGCSDMTRIRGCWEVFLKDLGYMKLEITECVNVLLQGIISDTHIKNTDCGTVVMIGEEGFWEDEEYRGTTVNTNCKSVATINLPWSITNIDCWETAQLWKKESSAL